MKRQLTYDQFLKAVDSHHVPEIEDFITDAAKSFELFPEYNNHAGRGVFVFVYPLKRYAYVNEALATLVGTSVEYIKQNGIGKNERHYYPPDEKVFDEEIFADTLDVFQKIPVEVQPNYLMTGNIRTVNKKGEIRNYLRECYFIKSSAEGLPLVSFGCVTDISHIKRDNWLGYAIRGRHGDIFSKRYLPIAEHDRLSSRQIEIIRLICEGLTTKEIADRLFISEKTVDNHKQNIRTVTNSRNVADMIKYASIHNYIDFGLS